MLLPVVLKRYFLYDVYTRTHHRPYYIGGETETECSNWKMCSRALSYHIVVGWWKKGILLIVTQRVRTKRRHNNLCVTDNR